ncbi:MAG: DUF2191 domain-containing protein [Myxococcales bacterium]|nr:DUF2191 domain-containing protein [Myxococcales bacterium]MCB9707993.1 DUF2191 domain-containing protein [Myxococcales bacterium]
MKTTVDLPEELLIEAKKLAAESQSTLRELIEEGLRSRLLKATLMRQRQAQRRTEIRWVTVPGGVGKELDVADRDAMYQWFDGHGDNRR